MCDPVSITLGVAAVMMAAGTGVSVYASQQQGKFQKDMANYQADLAKQRAGLAGQNAEIQAARLAEQRRMATAAGMAEFAANGMLIDGDPNSAPNLEQFGRRDRVAAGRASHAGDVQPGDLTPTPPC